MNCLIKKFMDRTKYIMKEALCFGGMDNVISVVIPVNEEYLEIKNFNKMNTNVGIEEKLHIIHAVDVCGNLSKTKFIS